MSTHICKYTNGQVSDVLIDQYKKKKVVFVPPGNVIPEMGLL